MVFYLAVAVCIVRVLWLSASYRDRSTGFIVPVGPVAIGKLLSLRSVQALVFAKFMSDSAWYFLLFWLPKYLYDARHFDIKQVSYYGWIPYAASGVGSFVGGYFSSSLLRRGQTIDKARKTALGLCVVFFFVV